jgi:methyltransferase-like protein
MQNHILELLNRYHYSKEVKEAVAEKQAVRHLVCAIDLKRIELLI